jgi:hypothetical protein
LHRDTTLDEGVGGSSGFSGLGVTARNKSEFEVSPFTDEDDLERSSWFNLGSWREVDVETSRCVVVFIDDLSTLALQVCGIHALADRFGVGDVIGLDIVEYELGVQDLENDFGCKGILSLEDLVILAFGVHERKLDEFLREKLFGVLSP